MLRNGLLSNVTRGTIRDADPQEWANVPEQHRRIWLDLKYRDNLPVLSKAEVISKPSHKINVDSSQLRRICSGRPANFIKPLGLGEIAVVQTKDKDHEYLEAREALQRGLGGMMLCRMR
ncbi:hypothetical protein FRC02_008397 [Tulasnella sp. 418]|nr:hypothetical protein FRC02_008397 [Tulasnella sp. 418]